MNLFSSTKIVPTVNILRELFEIKTVQVLLATFNGSNYLDEFLVSLMKQSNVKIYLTISDDGSTDNTLSIIHKYMNYFEKVEVTQGPQRGAKENFIYLLSLVKLEYVALADQDDIWDANHLENSVLRIEKYRDLPALTFCAVNILNDKSALISSTWPRKKLALSLKEFSFENHAKGCTMVMNRKFVQIYRGTNESIIMHDWWLALIAITSGILVYQPSPEITYRLHENNLIGNGPKFSKRICKILVNFRHREWAPLNQLISLKLIFGPGMRMVESAHLQKLELAQMPNGLKFRLILAFNRGRYRTKIIDEIIVRIALLVRWNLEQK